MCGPLRYLYGLRLGHRGHIVCAMNGIITFNEYQDILQENGDARKNLLIGNGFSRHICSEVDAQRNNFFDYTSLYDVAVNESLLTEAFQRLFELFETHVFESVLSKLAIAISVLDGLDFETNDFVRLYQNVRNGLIESIRRHHPDYNVFDEERLTAWNTFISSNFNSVFSLNYDLLLYWILMQDETQFVDFFFNQSYSRFDNLPRNGKIPIYYLHGAVHLFKPENRPTQKRTRTDLQDLLQIIRNAEHPPLCISEGRSEDKLELISSNGYLDFCLTRLSEVTDSITIFGCSLSPEQDQHIIDAINFAIDHPVEPGRRFVLGVSIRNANNVQKRRRTLLSVFPNLPEERLFLFDSQTLNPIVS